MGIPTVKYHTAESVTVKGCQAWFDREAERQGGRTRQRRVCG